MGSPGGNGGSHPEGGAPDDLPALPPEWGHIVIPDDASALDAEAALVRAELDRAEPGRAAAGRRRRPEPRPADTPDTPGPPGPLHRLTGGLRTGLRAPLLIMSLAVLVTLASLFTAAWPGLSRPAQVQRTAGTTPGRELPALELIAEDGHAVNLRSLKPAVIVLIDGCLCDELVSATAGAVGPGVAVLTVSAQRPSPAATSAVPPPAQQLPTQQPPAQQLPAPAASVAGAPGRVTPVVPPAGAVAAARRLTDPAGELRRTFDLPAPDGTAAVLLIDRAGALVKPFPRTASLDEFRPYLARL